MNTCKRFFILLMAAVLVCLSAAPAAFASNFTDVQGHWIESSGCLDQAVESGIIKGISNGDGTFSFAPEQKVTRAQIATMLCRYAGSCTNVLEENATPFSDVGDYAWYTQSVNWAYEKGVFHGSGGLMRPNDPISREELAAVLFNYHCNILGGDGTYASERLLKYQDYENVSAWATASVGWCVENGIMGATDWLCPNNGATRAEATKMIVVFANGGDLQPVLLKVHYIDVGQGDSIFIELPSGKTMLIDAGPSDAGETVVKYIRSKGYSGLDYVVMTHPDSDHVGGMLRVLQELSVGQLYAPDATSNTITWESLLTLIASKGMTVQTIASGDSISDSSTSIEFKWPSQSSLTTNDSSAVLKLTYNDEVYLFTGDATVNDLISAGVYKVDVLKVPHHGSSTGVSEYYLNAIQPKYAVISCGENNAYGHPTEYCLNLLYGCGANVYRTDMQGTVSSYCDGEDVWFDCVKVEKTVDQGEVVSPGSGSQIVDPTPATTTVYWTPSGAKYHRSTCSTLSRSKTIYSGTVSEAEASGRTACKVCKP